MLIARWENIKIVFLQYLQCILILNKIYGFENQYILVKYIHDPNSYKKIAVAIVDRFGVIILLFAFLYLTKLYWYMT